MAIHDIFSKRQKRLHDEMPDVYTYDKIPSPLRVQVVLILQSSGVLGGAVARAVVEALCHEYGRFSLHDFNKKLTVSRPYTKELIAFITDEEHYALTLDAIELTLQFMTKVYPCSELVAEINQRFQEHAIGYQFENGKIIRVDSQLIHSEVVKPTLSLLSDKAYAGAQEEFFSAHKHYRKGENKEAMTDACKSFESVMKVICKKRRWEVDENAPAAKLISVCFEHDLIPSFWKSQMNALQAMLKDGVPTGRNKTAAHGQGEVPVTVPEHVVSYVLHMTASAIVFLVKSEQALGETRG